MDREKKKRTVREKSKTKEKKSARRKTCPTGGYERYIQSREGQMGSQAQQYHRDGPNRQLQQNILCAKN